MGKQLRDIIRERVLILDGAMGTMIQSLGLTEEDFRGTRFRDLPGQQRGNNELLCLTRPEDIANIHRRYLAAGSDIVTTNTFNAQRISLADYHCQDLVHEVNLRAARLAREAADAFTRQTPEQPRFVAGSVGPTNKTCSLSPDVEDPARRALTFDELSAAYEEQMAALLEGGVDALLVETIFDTLNAKAAIYAAGHAMAAAGRDVPLMLSVTVADKGGRTLSGQTLDAFLASVSGANIFSVGLNCSFGAADLKPFLRQFAAKAPYYISAHPNAGLPNAMGQYDETPQHMAAEMREYVDEELVNIIGGCCGTTDEFIALYPDLVRTADGYRPIHQPAAPSQELQLSGLEVKVVGSIYQPENAQHRPTFSNIGERCNVAGSRKFLRLIREKDYDAAVAIARKQVEDGAQVIDINMDDGLLDTQTEMVHFLNLLASEPEVARVPFMIDSSKWDVIRAALKCVQGKCVVNSISLKEGEAAFLERAQEIRALGAAVVVMAFDERGQATTYERKIEICSRAYRLLTGIHFPAHDIIFDPNVLSICTGMEEHDAYALDFIRATRWIREHLPLVHVSGGISNLSFSFRGNNYIREAMHAVFLYNAIRNGLDMGIVNPAATVQYDEIPADLLQLLEDVVLNRRKAADELIEVAQQIAAEKAGEKTSAEPQQEAWRTLPLNERLAYALQKGNPTYLQADLAEALATYPRVVDIIEGPLMAGMNRVGDLFGEGKMFLPQVVKTARTMKAAVEILRPALEAGKAAETSAGHVVMATVKGDVHDIGKNIVGVVLACNNFAVEDLGVMVPEEQIVDRAKEGDVDLVGLSGLITPSLDEMVHTVAAMKEAGLRIPVLLGGATTSRLHTALKIAPAYDGPVFWVKDASQMVLVASRLMNPTTCDATIAENYAEQQRLREKHAAQQRGVTSLEEARKSKLNLFGENT